MLSASSPHPAELGDPVDAIDTPALVLDLDAFERNLDRMSRFCADQRLRLRAHAKTHKCVEVAKRQLERGAVGQCCQKVGEAEALVAGGISDVLVSNQVVGDAKLDRLAALARSSTVSLCFDDAEQVAAASRAARRAGVTLGGLVEIEVGGLRCGVAPGEPARELAQRVADAPGLRFGGIQAYQGKAQHLRTYDERRSAIDATVAAVRHTLDALDRAGLPCPDVTGAGTGTFRFEAGSGVYTELQAGSYAFMDSDYAGNKGADGRPVAEFEHSLFVLSTIMSVAGPDWAVFDAGLKSLSGESGPPLVEGHAELSVVGLSDEHAKVAIPKGAPRLKLGEKHRLIPGHCDPTINLHDEYVCVRNGRVEASWTIDARGRSR